MSTRNAAVPGLYRVAIVGAGTLKGKETKQLLEERNFPSYDIRLLDDDDSMGKLDAVADEPTFIQSVRPEHLEDVDFAFFTSEPDFTAKTWKIAQQAGASVVDLSYALESEPGVQVRAPWIERELGNLPAPDLTLKPVVPAHPAALSLALILLRARKAADIKVAVANIYEPASEQGRRGMNELHEQTVNLLSFQEMPQAVFDAQVAFNMLARYGEHAPRPLETAERRVLAHYRTIAGADAPLPSLVLVQVPVFHGHVFSVYIELAKQVAVGDFAQALAGDHVELARSAEDSPSNVIAAGKDVLSVSVRRDVGRENAFWVWAAADNLRIAALNAVECASAMAAARSSGIVQ